MKKQKVVWLSEPTLSVSLLLIEGGSLRKSNQVLTDYGVKDILPDPPSHSQAWTMRIDGVNHKKGLSFNALYWDGISITDLAHEIAHLVMSIFQDRGIPISIENEEIFAYHTGYWMKVITEKIKVTEL